MKEEEEKWIGSMFGVEALGCVEDGGLDSFGGTEKKGLLEVPDTPGSVCLRHEIAQGALLSTQTILLYA